ncbi:hypothetical protein C8Q75DRAFT_733564 [Abortiporus biennis]|nr:hypothetical protein C8Q75DRAFT_733564 [Abortiporus biennis]
MHPFGIHTTTTTIIFTVTLFISKLELALSSPLSTSSVYEEDLSQIPFAPYRPPRRDALQDQSAVFRDYDYVNGELPPQEDRLGWVDPRLDGGRFLDFTTRRLGEPLNIIISALSDPFVLSEKGLHVYSKSIGFSEECLGLHYGHLHEADLGDGDGKKYEHFLARQHYIPIVGTCWESLRGGHHFRAWRQNGTKVDSGAWFLGASEEKDSSKNHKITDDGYNRGRDFIVQRATQTTHWGGMYWKAEVEYVEGLLQKGSRGVNHAIEQDGLVAVLTVNRV